MKIFFSRSGFFYFFITLSLSFTPVLSFAKNTAKISVFKGDTVHEVRLNFSQPHYWDTLINRYESMQNQDSEEANTLLASVQIDGVKLDSIGVKLKSHFSYTIPTNKKPIKLYFNAFVKGRNFQGLKKLNLSNEFPDPSMLRNTVAFKIFREAGVRCPRTSFAKVYINDIYKGLYLIVEQVDKTFLSNNFKNSEGELIKPVASSLAWLPMDTMSFWKNFEIKAKNTPAAWTNLIAFAKKINTTPSNVFYDSLKNDFDFNSYVPVLAADIIFNNFDSYFYGQNYYLFRDSAENKYYYLPWDYNVSLNNYEVSGGDFSILPDGKKSDLFFKLPLPSGIISNDILRKKYLDELQRINAFMSTDSLENFINKMHAMIRPAMEADSGKVMTMEQFDNSLIHRISISEIDFEGLLTFIRYRHDQVNKMIQNERLKK